MKLIFAQGNPEPDYSSSRHNVGFLILNTITKQLELNWLNKTKFHSFITETTINGEKVIFIKPTSYYNETGPIVRKLIDFYKINPNTDLLVIHDDLSLKFGIIRVREKGNDAGNNGIKSINNHVDKSYKRIRVGIKNKLCDKIDDSDFVLTKFSTNEQKQLEEKIIPYITILVKQFCDNTIPITSNNKL